MVQFTTTTLSLLLLTISTLTLAHPPKKPSLNINTNVAPVHDDAPPAGEWPKTWTNGEQRNKPTSESPIQLPGSPIGGSENYNPQHVDGTKAPHNSAHHSAQKRDLARRAAVEAYGIVMRRWAEAEAEAEAYPEMYYEY
ncbi:MAG: hypothetical protein MMC33_009661 [Icmadophila ericetorum]|nr:hypothetical protein [Icmadophila ericetorum]